MKKISKKSPIGAIICLIVGIIFIIASFGFYFYTLPYTNTIIPGVESISLIIVGVVIIIGTIIGRRIAIFIPKENRENVIKGSAILIIGVIDLLSFIAFRINRPEAFNEYFFLYLDGSIIGIAIILAGIFTIRPMESKSGKKIPGISAMIFGVIIIIIPLFNISIWWNSGPGAKLGALAMASPLWLIGIIFFIYGLYLVKKAT